MQAITEMPIPFLPVDDPEFHRDPMPFVDAARAQHAWLARFESGYVIHGYQALKDLASMDDKLDMGLRGVVSFYRAEATPWARFMTEMLQSHSGPDHKRLRDSVAVAFTPRAANRMRPRMRIVITELLDQWAPAGEMDFADFAAWFPVSVLCGVLGVSTEPIPRLRSAIETYMNLFTLDRSILGDFLAAYDQLYAFMTVHMLLEYPDYWRRCAEDTDFCTRVIEEMLRHSGIATCFREVREDFVYEDHLFPEGTLLAFATPLAGRDPAAFPDPLKLAYPADSLRRLNPVTASGAGKRRGVGEVQCIGECGCAETHDGSGKRNKLVFHGIYLGLWLLTTDC